MIEENRERALAHARQEMPREACGLLVVVKGRERYFPCRNLASEPGEMFILDPDDFAAAEELGEVIGVFHSHPSTPAIASDADRLGCERSRLTWYICNPVDNAWSTISPLGENVPLIGRTWIWGVCDCWSLVRDWYAENGIKLRDWERPKTPEIFEVNPIFDSSWKETGFFRVNIEEEEIQYGDAVLMTIEGKGLNHCGVYVGDGLLLHHIRGRLSSRDLYGSWLQKCTGKVLRHYDWEKLKRV